MRRLAPACLLALALAAPAAAQEPTPSPTPTPSPEPEQRIAPGVKAGHVDVGGLLIAEAAAKLEQTLGAPLSEPVIVAVAGKRFTLKPGRAGFRWDATATAQDAYAAGQAAPPPAPEGGGAAPGIDVPLRTNVNSAKVKGFVATIDRAVKVAPRNARLRFTIRKMVRYHSHKGRDLEDRKVRTLVDATLRDPGLSRLLKPGRRETTPKIDAFDLAKIYPTVVTVHRNGFRLRLFKNLRLVKSYGVAVGAPGYATPTGTFSITNRAVNPVWTAPNKPWAGEFAGTSVPGGSATNPLKARWLGIVDGVGIHGTGAEYSIGSRASHGCIRMRVADVIALYPRVPIGTPVYIK
jgi:lipoprotein-anchoring transpeptidase ErfK/SrfK